jgi:hypothetical protein
MKEKDGLCSAETLGRSFFTIRIYWLWGRKKMMFYQWFSSLLYCNEVCVCVCVFSMLQKPASLESTTYLINHIWLL